MKWPSPSFFQSKFVLQLEAQLRAKPLLAEKQKELAEKYDLDDPAQSDKANKELEAYYSEIMTKDIGGNPEYRNRVNAISAVGSEAFAAANNTWKRSQSTPQYKELAVKLQSTAIRIAILDIFRKNILN